MNNNKDIRILCDPKKHCKQIEIPTADELKALHAMRGIKNRVRELKKELSDLSASERKGNADKIMRLEEEIARLRSSWNFWEGKRKEAARARMILLGHEEG